MRAARSSRIREDDGASLVLEQALVGRGALEDRAVGREVAEQRDQPARPLERLVQRADDGAVDEGRAGAAGAPRASRR